MVLHGHLIIKTECYGQKKIIKIIKMKKVEVDKYLHEKVEKGEVVSPVLPEGLKNYLIDIDGTI